MIVLTLICLCVLLFYKYVKNCHSYWEKRQIPTLPPAFFFGNILDTLLGRKNFLVPINEAYNKFKDYKYIGFYKCLSPTLVLIDPELIGNVLVKDFSHFEDNDIRIDEKADILMAKNVFVLKGQHWKSLKFLMSPMFTSGKLKHLYPLVEETASKLENYLRREMAAGRNVCIDGKHLAAKYTTENVANCAFGLNAQAFDTDSEFVKVARDFGNPSMFNALKINILFMVPSLGRFLSFSFFSKYVQDYLFDVVKQTLKYRKENHVERNDFLNMISQLKEKSTEYKFDDNDITAQAAGFFGDGIETSSIVICYCLYEIAKHADVQCQLRQEIEDVRQRFDDKITYEAINEMTYLDCVLNETMRIDVPLMALFKTCTKTYKLPPPKEGIPGIVVNPGDAILIPVEGLHKDASYFPEPEIFKPERFLKENKNAIRNYTYLPFGEGPRFCLGMRFGLLQVKVALVSIISNFNVSVNKKMQVPMELDPGTFMRMPKGGFWFDYSPIAKQQM